MSDGTSVTVVDHVPFTAFVLPEQAAAFVRRVLRGREEHVIDRLRDGPIWIAFNHPCDPQILVPLRADYADYARRMAELCDDLTRCHDVRIALDVAVVRPSDVLRAMAAEPIADGDKTTTPADTGQHR